MDIWSMTRNREFIPCRSNGRRSGMVLDHRACFFDGGGDGGASHSATRIIRMFYWSGFPDAHRPDVRIGTIGNKLDVNGPIMQNASAHTADAALDRSKHSRLLTWLVIRAAVDLCYGRIPHAWGCAYHVG